MKRADSSPKSGVMTSGLFEDRTGHTIEDYPGEIEKEYLLGVDDWGGWYYNPINENVRNYQLEGGLEEDSPLELTVGFSLDSEETQEEYEDISELAHDLVDRTVFGHSMVLADELSEYTHLTKPQAKVYALREVYSVGRTQTSRVLGKSTNTIDNQLSSAKTKAEKAKMFVRIVREYSPRKF